MRPPHSTHATSDEAFAARAAYLATRADVATSPNPRVGCVIVAADRIVAEGLFRRDGGPHAEIDALAKLPPASTLPRPELTAYVSLEPCSVTGRTPPCADRLVREGIGRVVVSALDQTTGVCGEGLARLRRGGAAVTFGPGQRLAYAIARPRNVFVAHHRPFVVLKQAVSADGAVGRRGSRVSITASMANVISHQWRADADAILVGVGTFLADAPTLSTRLVSGRSPDVVVYDPEGRLSPKRVAAHFGSAEMSAIDRRVYHATPEEAVSGYAEASITTLSLAAAAPLPSLLTALHERRLGRLLVEGGPSTLQDFASSRMWDEYRQWTSPRPLAQGAGAPIPACRIRGELLTSTRVGRDVLTTYSPLDRDCTAALNRD